MSDTAHRACVLRHGHVSFFTLSTLVPASLYVTNKVLASYCTSVASVPAPNYVSVYCPYGTAGPSSPNMLRCGPQASGVPACGRWQ
jgi:hypothetical protein